MNKYQRTDNDIGDEGARMISESLKINTTLTELYLESDENTKHQIINKEINNPTKSTNK